MESPEINTHIYGSLIFNKGGKNIQWASLFSKWYLEKLDSHMHFSETETHSHTMHKNKLKKSETLEHKTWHCKIPRGDHGKNIIWHKVYQGLFFFFFGCAHGMWKFLRQGWNLHHSCNQSQSCDNTRSLTHCAARELPSVFFCQSLKAIEIKAKINKCDLIKLTSFCTTKETINKIKR